MEVMEKVQSNTEARPPWPEADVADLAILRTGIVNLYLHGRPGAADGPWVLIDAGLPGSATRIMRARSF